MKTVTEDMVISTVDEQDSEIGTISRRKVFAQHDNFRVVHILVFNDRDELLIQRLPFNRTRHPGHWGSSVAGYVFAGETYESAAQRRLTEELGIHSPKMNFIGKTWMYDQGSKKFIAVFKAVCNGPFQFDHGHIDELEFLSPERVHELQLRKERPFTPTFLCVLDFFENGRLTS